MLIEQKLNKSQFQKAYLRFLFSKLSVKIIFGFFGLYLLVLIVLKISNPNIDAPIIPILFVIPLLIFFLYRIGGKQYDQNEDLKNNVRFDFHDDILHINGTIANSQIKLTKLYGIQESNNWFYIQTTKQSFYPIYKANLNEEQVSFLKSYDKQKVHNTM